MKNGRQREHHGDRRRGQGRGGGRVALILREKIITPTVSQPLDHRRVDTVSSLKAVMKMSSAPAAAAGAASGAVMKKVRAGKRMPATRPASSSAGSSVPSAPATGRSASGRKRAR
jgi:hypothetical protein